ARAGMFGGRQQRTGSRAPATRILVCREQTVPVQDATAREQTAGAPGVRRVGRRAAAQRSEAEARERAVSRSARQARSALARPPDVARRTRPSVAAGQAGFS